jgi:outer membrane murein-binding lipoprotein Lpp
VKDLYSRITNLESKVFSLEKDLQIFAGTPCAPLRERLCVPEPDFQKPRDIPYQQDPFRRGLPNPFSGAGQTLKKDDQSAGVKDLYSRITNLESKVSLLEMRI